MEVRSLERVAAALEDARTRALVERLARGGAGAGRALALSPFQVMGELDVGLAEARAVLAAVARAVAPRVAPAADLLAATRAPLRTPLRELALRPGYLTEIVGRAGAGKTQLCLACAVDAACAGRASVYIDTENKFSVERVVELIHARLGPAAAEDAVRRAADRILVYAPKTAARLATLLDTLETVLVEKEVGLVVLDSVAALARGDNRPGIDLIRRQSTLARIAAHLKFLAEACHLPVLLTNQVMARFAEAGPGAAAILTADAHPVAGAGSDVSAGSALRGGAVALQPALGNTWSHCVNVRITFELQSAQTLVRRARIVKSPESPELEAFFRITPAGLEQVAAPPGNDDQHMARDAE